MQSTELPRKKVQRRLYEYSLATFQKGCYWFRLNIGLVLVHVGDADGSLKICKNSNANSGNEYAMAA